jgi:hypothetical protein
MSRYAFACRTFWLPLQHLHPKHSIPKHLDPSHIQSQHPDPNDEARQPQINVSHNDYIQSLSSAAPALTANHRLNMRWEDLELPTQALISINLLIAFIPITLLAFLKLLVGISFRRASTQSQLLGTLVVFYILVNTFPEFFNAFWAYRWRHLAGQLRASKAPHDCRMQCCLAYVSWCYGCCFHGSDCGLL